MEKFSLPHRYALKFLEQSNLSQCLIAAIALRWSEILKIIPALAGLKDLVAANRPGYSHALSIILRCNHLWLITHGHNTKSSVFCRVRSNTRAGNCSFPLFYSERIANFCIRYFVLTVALSVLLKFTACCGKIQRNILERGNGNKSFTVGG